VYEGTRRALIDDVGLQPSAELQQLSGRMVRQEPELDAPGRVASQPKAPSSAVDAGHPPRRNRRRAWGRARVAVGAAAAVTLTAGGATSAPDAVIQQAAGTDIALVLPHAVNRSQIYDRESEYVTALTMATYTYKSIRKQTMVAPDTDLDRVDAVAAALRENDYELVLWLGEGEAARRVLSTVRDLPETRFVFLDASADTLGPGTLPNASAVRFAGEDIGELVGYLSGLVPQRGGQPAARVE
jgi:hypothetical protein